LAAATWRDDLREDHNLTRARVRKHEAHFKVSPELFILANHCQWTTK
jgi:hypothetical protein